MSKKLEPKQLKAIAIAKLKNGESVENVADDLEVSSSLIEEWREDFSEDDLQAVEINALAVKKASVLMKDERIKVKICDKEEFYNAIYNIAVSLTDEMKININSQDTNLARYYKLTAETLSILHNTFYSNGPDIAIVNNIQNSNNELSTFKGLLRN